MKVALIKPWAAYTQAGGLSIADALKASLLQTASEEPTDRWAEQLEKQASFLAEIAEQLHEKRLLTDDFIKGHLSWMFDVESKFEEGGDDE